MSLAFDASYYQTTRPDVFNAFVATAGSTGLTWAEFAQNHYNTFGRFEGSNPTANFNTNEYLAANVDVAAAGVNPFDHFLEFGSLEGRVPYATFPLSSLDTAAYAAANPDLAAAGITTEAQLQQHFMLFGQFESRSGAPTVTQPDSNPGSTFTLTTAAGEAITGTTADDTFNAIVGTGATLNTFDTIDGLTGTDTANIEADASVTLAQLNQFSNVESFKINQTGTQAGLDISGISSITAFSVDGVVTKAAQFTVGQGQTISLAADATDNDIDVIAAKDVTALNIVSLDTDLDALVTSETNTSVTSVSLSGKSSGTVAVGGTATTETLNVSLENDASLTFSGAKVATIDASGSTGKLTVDTDGVEGTVTSLTTGGKNDSVADSTYTKAFTADLGAGNDVFTIAEGDAASTVGVTLGDGNDTVDVNALANADIDNIGNTLITINDFSVANDVLDLAGIAGTDGYQALNNTQLANIAGEATIEAAAAAAAVFLDTANDDGFTIFNYGSDSYVILNDGTAAWADTDGIMKITGVQVGDFTGASLITA